MINSTLSSLVKDWSTIQKRHESLKLEQKELSRRYETNTTLGSSADSYAQNFIHDLNPKIIQLNTDTQSWCSRASRYMEENISNENTLSRAIYPGATQEAAENRKQLISFFKKNSFS